MNISFDLRWAVHDMGGIRRYAERVLAGIGSSEDRVTLVVRAGREREVRHLAPAVGDVSFLAVRYGPYDPFNAWDLVPRLRRMGAEVFHSPGPALPLADTRGRPAQVVNVHDLIPYAHPALCPRSLKARLRPIYGWWLGKVLHHADAVVTGSMYTAWEIVRYFPEVRARLYTVYNGVTRVPIGDPDGARWQVFAERIGVHGPFALYIGRHDDSKNLERMIRAFAAVHRTMPDVRFIVAGAHARLTERLRATARAAGCADAVRFPGAVSDEEAGLLFAHARFLAFCTLAEGFGLPVVEAMACGCPVLTSPVSSLPEVAGDAALYADPRSTEAMANAMRRLFENPGLRTDLVRRGYVRAAHFSWATTTARLREIYRAVIAPGNAAGETHG